MTTDANTRIIAEINESPSETINSTQKVINPNILKTIVNAISGDITTYLHGRSINSSKTIEVIGAFTCILQTNTGTFLLTSSNTPVTLYYDASTGRWIDPTFGVRSYPLTKKTQKEDNVPPDSDGETRQGLFCAINYFETTVADPAFFDLTAPNNGSLWVFVKNNLEMWSQQGNKIVADSSAIRFPLSVALDDTGNIMAIGEGRSEEPMGLFVGSSRIFTRENAVWTEGQTLIGNNNIGDSNQGRSIALSGNGSVLVVGGSTDNANSGAVWIFNRNLTTYIQFTKLAGPILNGYFGGDVDIDANGTVILVGAFGSDNVYIYTLIGTLWTLYSDYASILTAQSIVIPTGLGKAVAINGDGTRQIALSTIGDVVFLTLVRVGNTFVSSIAQKISLSNFSAGQQIHFNLAITFTGDVAINRQGTVAVASSNYANTVDAFTFNETTRQWTYTEQNIVIAESPNNLLPSLQGTSLAFKNNILAVGAPQHNNDIGGIHLWSLSATNKFNYLTTLSGRDYERISSFGSSASISGNGLYSIVSGPTDGNGNRGSVWFYKRDGSSWTQMGGKKFPPIITINTRFGWTVSMNYDGTVAVVGIATGTNFVYVYRRTNDTWTLSETVTAPDIQPGKRFGIHVSINNDGTKMVVSDDIYDFGIGFSQGAIWYYTYNGVSWSTAGAVQGTGTNDNDRLTTSEDGNGPLDISGDGTTIAAGSYSHNSFDGGVWIFENGIYQAGPIQASGTVGAGTLQGFSVALSKDGNTLASGATGYSTNGGVFIFTRTSGVWTEQQKITSSHVVGIELIGHDLDLSSDGNILIVSRNSAGGFVPGGTAICIFQRISGVWSEITLSPIIDIPPTELGPRVTISADGSIALATAPSFVQSKAGTLSGGFITLA